MQARQPAVAGGRSGLGVRAAKANRPQHAVASPTSPRLPAPASRPPMADMSLQRSFVVVAYLGERGLESVTNWALAAPASIQPDLPRRLLDASLKKSEQPLGQEAKIAGKAAAGKTDVTTFLRLFQMHESRHVLNARQA